MNFSFLISYLGFVVVILFVTVGLFRMKGNGSIEIAIMFFVVSSLAVFFVGRNDLTQREIFQDKIDSNEVYEASGIVTNFVKFNGQMKFSVEGVNFEVSYRPYLCLGGRDLVGKNQEVMIQFVNMPKGRHGRNQNCIVSIEYLSLPEIPEKIVRRRGGNK